MAALILTLFFVFPAVFIAVVAAAVISSEITRWFLLIIGVPFSIVSHSRSKAELRRNKRYSIRAHRERNPHLYGPDGGPLDDQERQSQQMGW